MLRAAVVLSTMLLLEPRRADACSCFPPPSTVVPQPGATGVPLNPQSITFTAANPTDAYLERSTGAGPLRGEIEKLSESSYAFHPSVALEPNSVYRLHVIDGVSESERSFTTGAETDLQPPPAPRFEDLHLGWSEEGNGASCGGPTVVISGLIAAPPDANIVTIGMRFTPSSGASREVVLWPESGIHERTGEQVWFPDQLGATPCKNRLVLAPSTTYAVEAWTIDRGGRTSEPTAASFTVDSAGCSAAAGQALGCVLLVLPALVRRRRAIVRA